MNVKKVILYGFLGLSAIVYTFGVYNLGLHHAKPVYNLHSDINPHIQEAHTNKNEVANNNRPVGPKILLESLADNPPQTYQAKFTYKNNLMIGNVRTGECVNLPPPNLPEFINVTVCWDHEGSLNVKGSIRPLRDSMKNFSFQRDISFDKFQNGPVDITLLEGKWK